MMTSPSPASCVVVGPAQVHSSVILLAGTAAVAAPSAPLSALSVCV